MPQASNITLTDETGAERLFALLSPAAGYGGIAEWRYAETAYPEANPTITSQAVKRATSNKSKWRLATPIASVADGVVTKTGDIMSHAECTVPLAAPTSLRIRHAALFAALVFNDLCKQAMQDGLPTT